MTGPVEWVPPRRITHPALAVPCGHCGAYIGKACTDSYSTGKPAEPHAIRHMIAEAHGFRWAKGVGSSDPLPAPRPPDQDLPLFAEISAT
jgi:hypothetical protein